MAWDTPAGWQDPKEAAAAAEAAEKMAAARAEADARTAALADAIRDGFSTLSAAVMTAAGCSDDTIRAFFHGDQPIDDPAPPPLPPLATSVKKYDGLTWVSETGAMYRLHYVDTGEDGDPAMLADGIEDILDPDGDDQNT